MTRTSPKAIDESTLEKRQLCKPYVLRKSVGNEIGERAFARVAFVAARRGED